MNRRRNGHARDAALPMLLQRPAGPAGPRGPVWFHRMGRSFRRHLLARRSAPVFLLAHAPITGRPSMSSFVNPSPIRKARETVRPVPYFPSHPWLRAVGLYDELAIGLFDAFTQRAAIAFDRCVDYAGAMLFSDFN